MVMKGNELSTDWPMMTVSPSSGPSESEVVVRSTTCSPMSPPWKAALTSWIESSRATWLESLTGDPSPLPFATKIRSSVFGFQLAESQFDPLTPAQSFEFLIRSVPER